jgi:CheY-like chemotaxis protein
MTAPWPPPTPHARLLVVEDSPELAALMRLALETEGYAVDLSRTAEDGLHLLQSGRYDLVISDYMLPGRTGTWLMREALQRRLLHGAATLLVTAQPDAPDIAPGQSIVAKPFDFDQFLPQIRAILANRHLGAMRSHTDRVSMNTQLPVELILYVSPSSIACAKAQRVMENILRGYDPASIDFQVRDLTTETDAAARDRILYTPTLLKRSPPPSVWVLGDLSRPWIITDLLQMCGINPLATA